jgi:hypothetical protein
MEDKLIQGKEIMDKASQQEVELRRAKVELAAREREELRLKQELEAKEENFMEINQHFESLHEEVEVKTKKLKKLYQKYQAAVSEAKDLQNEFQNERDDTLEMIRQLTRALKLKDLVIQNFIPEEHAKNIEKRANWNAEEEAWVIPKLDLSGNKVRLNRPLANAKGKRPETEFARIKRTQGNDPNPRYKQDSIISLDLDMPERTTQDFEGPGMVSRVDAVLGMNLNDEAEEVSFDHAAQGAGNGGQYLNYGGGNDDDSSRERTKNNSRRVKASAGGEVRESRGSSASSSRPKSASRRREEADASGGVAYSSNESNPRPSRTDSYDKHDPYPTSRGLIRK